MTKSLIIVEGHSAKRFVLGKNVKPIVDVRSRTLRVDDDWCWKDLEGPDCCIIYPIDSSQPYDRGDSVIDPNETMAKIDLGKSSHSKNVTYLSKIQGMNGMTFVYMAVGVIIVLGALGLV